MLIFHESEVRFGGSGRGKVNFLTTIQDGRAVIARLLDRFFLIITTLAIFSLVALFSISRRSMLEISKVSGGVSSPSHGRGPKDGAKDAGGIRRRR